MTRMKTRIWALFLSAALIAAQPPAAAMAENSVPKEGGIASFEPLDSSIAHQTVDIGTELPELLLPDTLAAHIYQAAAETADSGGEDFNADKTEDDPGHENGPGEGAGGVSGSGDSSETGSGKPAAAASRKEIPAAWSSEPAYDGGTEGIYVFTADPGGYVLSESAELPQITVEVKGDAAAEGDAGKKPAENPAEGPLPCTKEEGCTLEGGHEGPCAAAQPADSVSAVYGAELYGAAAYAADGQLDIGNGPIVITETGYSQNGQPEIPYTGSYRIAGTAAAGEGVWVQSGSHEITLDNLSIRLNSDDACAFSVRPGSVVRIILSGTNVLSSGRNRAGLEVPGNARAEITGGSSDRLEARGGSYSAGIGAGIGGSGGSITIGGSASVSAQGGDGGAGIGGGIGGSGGSITIQGSASVTAQGGRGNGTGIGGGTGGSITMQGSAGTIRISGGIVHAEGTDSGSGIGGTGGSLAVNGSSLVYASAAAGAEPISSSLDVRAEAGGGGIVFENGSGTVYGNSKLPGSITIPGGSSLAVPEGSVLAIPDNAALTLDGTVISRGIIENYGTAAGGGTIENYGTANDYSDGISVSVTGSPANKPSEIVISFWQDGRKLEGGTAAAGSTVTVRAEAFRKNTRLPSAASGSMVFKTGQTVLGTAGAVNGTASLSLPLAGDSWKPGSYTVDAEYGGGTGLLPCTGSALLAVVPPAEPPVVPPVVIPPAEPSGGSGGRGPSAPDTLRDVYVLEGASFSLEVPLHELAALAASGRSLSISCEGAGMYLRPAALSAILAAAPGAAESAVFAAAPADAALLSETQEAAAGSPRPAYGFALSYKTGGRAAKADVLFPAGQASVFLAYAPAPGETPGSLFMASADGAGAAVLLPRSFYEEGRIIAEVPRFSVYGAAYKAPAPAFADASSHWAWEEIEFAAARGFLPGTEEGLFSPDAPVSRGSFAAALGQLAGISPDAFQSRSFADVDKDDWRAPYIEWAAAERIIHAAAPPLFSPDAPLSREEMAAAAADFAAKTGCILPAPLAAAGFADSALISAQAAEKASALQQAGIIRARKNGLFEPQAAATRAEAAAVLRRFLEASASPSPASGWEKNDAGSWLYYKDGAALTGWQALGGSWYYFYEDGALAENTAVDGYEIGPDGIRIEAE